MPALVRRPGSAHGAEAVAPVEPLENGRKTPTPADPNHHDEISAVPDSGPGVEEVREPGKAMRIGAMVSELLAEVHGAPLDQASRQRLGEIYDESIRELASTLSPDLAREVTRMALAANGTAPSEAELRVAQAQLVGWLEGLFHGIEATLFAQQIEARLRDHLRQEAAQEYSPKGPPKALARTGNYL